MSTPQCSPAPKTLNQEIIKKLKKGIEINPAD